MEKHTHIITWNDGEADWSMTIQDGRVGITTSGDATRDDAAASLSQQWSALMGFVVNERQPLNRLSDAK